MWVLPARGTAASGRCAFSRGGLALPSFALGEDIVLRTPFGNALRRSPTLCAAAPRAVGIEG